MSVGMTMLGGPLVMFCWLVVLVYIGVILLG